MQITYPDKYGKLLKLGDKVHIHGRASDIRYVVEFCGDSGVGVSADKNGDPSTSNCVSSRCLVKTKNQDENKSSI